MLHLISTTEDKTFSNRQSSWNKRDLISRKSICHAWGKLTILLQQRLCPKQQSSCSSCHSTSSVMPSMYRWIEKNSEACCLPFTSHGGLSSAPIVFCQSHWKVLEFFTCVSWHLIFGAKGSGFLLYQIILSVVIIAQESLKIPKN